MNTYKHKCFKNFLSAAECKAYAQFIDNLPLELTPPKKRGEASRVNCEFAQALSPSDLKYRTFH